MVITSDSRRAFVLTQQNDNSQPCYGYYLWAIELDGWTADGWALTGGRVAPVCVPGAVKPTARLGHPSASTGLAQVFAVTGGQTYELRFSARALGDKRRRRSVLAEQELRAGGPVDAGDRCLNLAASG